MFSFIYINKGPEEPIYDTDHTDLNSDYDEAELRRELLKDVRPFFDSIKSKLNNSFFHRNFVFFLTQLIQRASERYR